MTREVSEEALAADQRGCDAYHAWRDDQPTDLHRRVFVAPAKRVEAVEEVGDQMPPPCKLQGRLDEIRADFERRKIMIDYDKIARAMYEAYRAEYASVAVGTAPWANLDAVELQAWIAAAQAAHKEIMEVH